MTPEPSDMADDDNYSSKLKQINPATCINHMAFYNNKNKTPHPIGYLYPLFKTHEILDFDWQM